MKNLLASPATWIMASVFLAPAASARAGFTPNHVFICAYNADEISEFDAAGTFVRSFGSGTGMDGPRDCVFGADQRLYVTGNNGSNRVYVFNDDGVVVEEIGASAGLDFPSGLAFGPNGNLYVTSFSNFKVLEFGPAGTMVGGLGLSTVISPPSDIEFGVDGHAFVSSSTGDKIYEIDPTDVILRTIDLAGQPLDGADWVGFSSTGRLLATGANLDAIYEFALDGTVLNNVSTVLHTSRPAGAAIGPDGALWVCGSTDNEVLRIEDGVVTSFGDVSTTAFPIALAFAPFYLDAQIKGTLLVAGQDPRKLKLNVTLGYAPGSRLVSVLPKPSSESDFIDAFGTPTRVFRGVEVERSQKVRQLDVASAAGHAVGGAAAAMSLSANGKTKAGLFRPTKLSGAIQIAAEGRVFNGSVKTK